MINPSSWTESDRNSLIEILAAIEHERWSHWQRFLHEQGEHRADGSITLPAHLVSRWTRQIETPYSELTEKEKESDREQVRKTLSALERFCGSLE